MTDFMLQLHCISIPGAAALYISLHPILSSTSCLWLSALWQAVSDCFLLVSFSFGGEGGDTGWHVINDLSLMCPGPTFTL